MGRARRKFYHDDAGPERNMSANYRLRDLLQLRNNPTLFGQFKKQLYHITEKHLNVNDQPRHQLEGWTAIENELLSTFPDIFECEGPKIRLDLAMQVMEAYHHRRRFASKNLRTPTAEHSPKKHKLVMSVSVSTRASMRKKRLEEKKRKEEDIIYITDDDNDECDENQKVEFVEPKLPQVVDLSNLQPGPATTIETASRAVSPLGPVSLPIVRPPTAFIKSQSTPPRAESSSRAQSSNASLNQDKPEDAFQLAGVTRVARFLNACFPSMVHLLKHFIDFGCTSEEYLLAVSTWPTERILYFLSQVSSRGGDERKLSEMDMLVLQNHFISYFNKAQT